MKREGDCGIPSDVGGLRSLTRPTEKNAATGAMPVAAIRSATTPSAKPKNVACNRHAAVVRPVHETMEQQGKEAMNISTKNDIMLDIRRITDVANADYQGAALLEDCREDLSLTLRLLKSAAHFASGLDPERNDEHWDLMCRAYQAGCSAGDITDDLVINTPFSLPHRITLWTGPFAQIGDHEGAFLMAADHEFYQFHHLSRHEGRCWLPDTTLSAYFGEEPMCRLSPALELMAKPTAEETCPTCQSKILFFIMVVLISLTKAEYPSGCDCPDEVVRLSAARH